MYFTGIVDVCHTKVTEKQRVAISRTDVSMSCTVFYLFIFFLERFSFGHMAHGKIPFSYNFSPLGALCSLPFMLDLFYFFIQYKT